MRQLTAHHVGPLNSALTIDVLDGPGAGGASTRYRLGYSSRVPGEAEYSPVQTSRLTGATTNLRFQSGDPAVEGVNGITNEGLLAVLIDRMAGFQDGPFACEQNGKALLHLRLALDALQARTEERLKRGVEGTLAK